MCDEAVRIDAWLRYHVPDYLKTHEMCEKAIEENRDGLRHVPDNLKM